MWPALPSLLMAPPPAHAVARVDPAEDRNRIPAHHTQRLAQRTELCPQLGEAFGGESPLPRGRILLRPELGLGNIERKNRSLRRRECQRTVIASAQVTPEPDEMPRRLPTNSPAPSSPSL